MKNAVCTSAKMHPVFSKGKSDCYSICFWVSHIIDENIAQQYFLHWYQLFVAETKDTTHSAHLGKLWDILQWGVAEAVHGWSVLKDLRHHVALHFPSWKSLRKILLPVPGKDSERQQTQRAAVTPGRRSQALYTQQRLPYFERRGKGDIRYIT